MTSMSPSKFGCSPSHQAERIDRSKVDFTKFTYEDLDMNIILGDDVHKEVFHQLDEEKLEPY